MPLTLRMQRWKEHIRHKLREMNEHVHALVVSSVCRDYFFHQIHYVTNTPIVRGCGLVLTCELSSRGEERELMNACIDIKNTLCLMLQELVFKHNHELVFLYELLVSDLFEVVFIPWTVEFNQRLNSSVDQSELTQLKDYFANKDAE